MLLAAPAGAACRQALALGLDVSDSVDAREYRLQMDGLAGALLKGEVQQAFLAFPDAPVRLYIFEWAGSGSRRLILDWHEIASASDLQAVADLLRRTGRMPMDPATAIGEAMRAGAGALAAQGECWRRVLDLSGDGESNSGARPREVRGDAAFAGITVNGLVIGQVARGGRRSAGIAQLQAYYAAEVILGPDAFTEVALGFDDFEAAMTRKLLRELQSIAISRLDGRD